MLRIGQFEHPSNVIIAPMAGVTDQPFRNICRQQGAYWMISEMVTSREDLWSSPKSRGRLPDINEQEPRWVQIAGTEPDQLVAASRGNVELGAQIIDINMGCPAKKVCRKLAGSALLKDERLVENILNSVVSAVDVPVTLKMRLGWSKDSVNAVRIAKIAENAGVQLISVHGRTRACRFSGEVDYETIGQVKSSVNIPVIANGDIQSPLQAKQLVQKYEFDGIMIGRALLGRPWLAKQISAELLNEQLPDAPQREVYLELLITHLDSLAKYYGENRGMRIARKHIGWYLQYIANGKDMARYFNRLPSAEKQKDFIRNVVADEVSKGRLAA